MIAIGQFNTLRIVQARPEGLYLGTAKYQVLLPQPEGPVGARIGDELNVFVYTDSQDVPVATLRQPYAVVGEFATLKVVHANAQGAFLDWGLAKDLFVPNNQQQRPLVVGQNYVVAVYLDDRTNRVAAATRLGRFLDYDVSGVVAGTEVNLRVYDFSERGAQVIVEGRYSGLVYVSEIYTPLVIGQELRGFVDVVRADNKLDIRLRRQGHQASSDAKAIILERLKSQGGFLPLHDHSSPDEIRAALGISKKVFKMAVGGLFRSRRVELVEGGVRLIESEKAGSVN